MIADRPHPSEAPVAVVRKLSASGCGQTGLRRCVAVPAGVSEGWSLMTGSKIDGFRLGIYVFEDAEVVDLPAT